MRIAFTGAHQAGKTTLARWVHERLPHYTFIPEPYHEMEESGFAFQEMPGVEEFTLQFEHALSQFAIPGPDILYDKWGLDILAYIHALQPDMDIRRMFSEMQEMAPGIDLVVYVPVERKWEAEQGIVIEHPKLRERVNDIMRRWLEDIQAEYIKVGGTTNERVDQVMMRIAEFG